MRVNYFIPDLDLVVDEAAKQVVLSCPSVGFEMRGNFDSVARDGMVPHGTAVISKQTADIPIQTCIDFEDRFSRRDGPPTPLEGKPSVIPFGSANDWHDDCANSHATSGARRHPTSVGYQRARRGLADGRASISSWANDQHKRPTCWWPFTDSFKWGNGYYGELATGTLLGDWQYDDRMTNGVRDPKSGWAVFDPAHLESAILFGGAALGDLECLGLLTMGLAPWVLNTYPGGGIAGRVMKGWRGSDQERAVGRVIKSVADFALLGIGVGPECQEFRDRFLCGLDPKHHLVGLVQNVVRRLPPLGSGTVSESAFTDFKDGSKEVQSFYPWQNAIMLHDLQRGVVMSGLIGGTAKRDIQGFCVARARQMVEMACTDRGVAWTMSSHEHFTQSSPYPLNDPRNQSCDKANAIEQDASKTYEFVENKDGVPDTGWLRDAPRQPDSQLMAGALALVLPADPMVQQLLAINPKPGQSGYKGDGARWLDVAYAAQNAPVPVP